MKNVSVIEFVTVTASMAIIIAVAVLWIATLLEPSIGAWKAALIGFAIGAMVAFYSGVTYARLRPFDD